MATALDPKAVKAAKAGYADLAKQGFTQAQLSRLFQVDSATVWTWKQTQRIGERVVGRANYIPELKKAGITLNRKMLSEMAARDGGSFKKLVSLAQGA